MSVSIYPKYSTSFSDSTKLESLEVDIAGDNVEITFMSDDNENLTEIHFNKDYFRRHLTILIKLGNSFSLQPIPTSYNNGCSGTLDAYLTSDGEIIKFSYSGLHFELDTNRTEELFDILLG